MRDEISPDGGNSENSHSEDFQTLTYEIGRDKSPSDAVVRAVAEFTHTPPLDLDPLYDTVDPDHLDALFEGTSDDTVRTDRTFTFTFAGCVVSVTADEISVSEPEETSA